MIRYSSKTGTEWLRNLLSGNKFNKQKKNEIRQEP